MRDQKPLRVNGAYTFAPLGGEMPKAEVLAALATGFGRLEYNLGLLTPREARLLAEAKVAPPAAWKPVADKPVAHVLQSGAFQVGLVLLPELPDGAVEQQVKALAPQALAAGRELAPKVDLLVAVSPWGQRAEELLLATPGLPFQLLLGGGPGGGVNGKLLNDGRTLWMRAYEKGKAVQRIDILAMPARGQAAAWASEETIRWKTESLKATYADDPDMAALFAPFAK